MKNIELDLACRYLKMTLVHWKEIAKEKIEDEEKKAGLVKLNGITASVELEIIPEM